MDRAIGKKMQVYLFEELASNPLSVAAGFKYNKP